MKRILGTKPLHFYKKISLLFIGIILVTSLVPIQSASAALGISFAPSKNLSITTVLENEINPQVAASGDNVYVVWQGEVI